MSLIEKTEIDIPLTAEYPFPFSAELGLKDETTNYDGLIRR